MVSARGMKPLFTDDGDEEEEMWGKDVDDLVAWSSKLDNEIL